MVLILETHLFSKKLSLMIKSGELVHIGRDLYCLPKDDKYVYSHEYSDLANEVAQIMKEQYPLLDFCIFEKYQLNQFVNHLIARNTIFLSVEARYSTVTPSAYAIFKAFSTLGED